jgi:hypothetical protein
MWEKIGDSKDNTGLTEVDLLKLAITGPTVVYFPGREESDSNATGLSKGLRFVNKLLSDMPAPPQVYMWSQPDKYAHKPPVGYLSTLFHVAAYRFRAQHFHPPSLNRLADKLIMPLVVDEAGKPDFERGQKNLRNLTFLGYCLGSVTAQEFHNACMSRMQKAGYSKEDARKLLREVVLVNIATFSDPRQEKNRWTTVALANTDDRFIQIKNGLMHPLLTLLRLRHAFSNANRRLKIRSLSDTSLLVTAAARGRFVSRLRKPKEIIADVRLPRWKMGSTNHEPQYYGFNDSGENARADKKCQLSRIVQHALINAVNRSQLPVTEPVKPLDLLAPPPGLDISVTAPYRQKIERAIVGARV